MNYNDDGATIIGVIVVIIIIIIIICIIAWIANLGDDGRKGGYGHPKAYRLKGSKWAGKCTRVTSSILTNGDESRQFSDVNLEFVNVEGRRVGVKVDWVAKNSDGSSTASGTDEFFGAEKLDNEIILTDLAEQATLTLRPMNKYHLEYTYVETDSSSGPDFKTVVQGVLTRVRLYKH